MGAFLAENGAAMFVGAVVNVATTAITAGILGEKYTLKDAVMAAVTGAVGASGPAGPLAAGLISGFVTYAYANVVFESNHSNAFNGKAYGVNVIRSAHLPASEKLADRMIDAIVKVMKLSTGITYNRGVTTKTQSNGADWYGVIRGAVSGATTQGQAKNGPVRYDYIVEHGFHDNQKECQFLSKQENLKAIAEVKAAVIADYFDISDKGQSGSQGGQSDKNNQNGQNSQNKQSTDTDSSAQNKKTFYLVRVSIDNLNIRQSSTIHSAAVGFTGKGTFTITEEATGVVNAAGDKSRWGKLKSGRGWICLDYAEKIG